MNLHEIAIEYRNLADCLIEQDLPPEVVRDTLEAESGALEVKVANIALMVRQLEGEAELAKAEARRILDMAKSRERARERLLEWLKYGMETAGVSEIKAGIFTVRIKNNPPSVVVNNPDLVPPEFMRIIPESREVNKAEISRALKAGATVAGCHLENKTSVVMK